jgi:hypothetical protein
MFDFTRLLVDTNILGKKGCISLYSSAKIMVKCITFIEFTTNFLSLPLEKREEQVRKWIQLASKYSIKFLFYGIPMGVKEHALCVFEYSGKNEIYFKFQREWLGLGTPEACKYVKNTRTIIVY